MDAAASGDFTDAIVRGRRLGVAFTYALTVLENVFELLYPFAIGLAIDGLIAGETWLALWPFVAIWTAHIATGVGRQTYDTRLFTRLYADLATETILRQRQAGSQTSEVAARSAMAREIIDFFETEIPVIATTVVGLAGGVAMLCVYDGFAGATMAGLLVPVLIVNHFHARRSLRLNRGLNDRLEREVKTIAEGTRAALAAHFMALSRWRVRISDAQATTWAIVEGCAVAAVVVVLIRAASVPGAQAGEIFAMLAYVIRILESLGEAPTIVSQLARLSDIRRRIVS